MTAREANELIYYPQDAALTPRADTETLLGAIGKSRELSSIQLTDPKHGLETGVWKLQGFVEGAVETDRHIFMFVQSGTVGLTGADGSSRHFESGEAFVIPKGATITWRQVADFQAAYYTCLDAAPTRRDASFIPIDPDAPRTPKRQTPEPDFYLSSPPPIQSGNDHFTDSTGFWKAGVWGSTPYRRRILPFPRHEFIHLLAGNTIIRTQDGQVLHFRQGDTFLVPYRLISDWEVSEPVRKFYCYFTGH